MLKFIAGRAGTGKTYTALRDAVAAAPSHKMTYIIVPEQSTLSYEKQLIEYNAEARRLGVEVLSFTRLVEKVMLVTGGLAGNYIDSMGKTALIYRAVRDCADTLTLFGKYADDPRFALRIAETADELKINGVSPDALLAASEGEGLADTLRGKMRDTALIVREYERLISGSFFDPADKLTALGEILDGEDFFSGCAVYFDGFVGFTPQEEAVIRRIIKQSAVCVVSLTAPSDGMDVGEEFYPVALMAERFRSFARDTGVEIGKATVLNENHKFKTPSMLLLESKLYSGESGVAGGEGITVYAAADPYDEMRYVASEIRRLTAEEGCRYRDIAVIAGDLEACRSAAEIEFELYGIPYFIDSRRDVRFKPLMRLVLFAIRAATHGMYYEDMADLAKTGLAGIDVEQSSLLENYINLWRVSGVKWGARFTLNPSGFAEEMKESDAELLDVVNEARDKLATPLFAFAENLASARTADDFAKAIYEYLLSAGAAETIRAQREAAIAAGEEYDGDRMWELLMDVLDRISSAMGGETVSKDGYAELLRIMFENADVGVIPPHADEVIIGSEGRARVEHIKYCFIVGATDEAFPRPFGQKGVFTNADKEDLFKLDVPLIHEEEVRRCELMLSVYNALTIPSHGLTVSYSASESALSVSAPSRVILDLKNTFKDCRRIEASELEYADVCSAPAAALDICAPFYEAPENVGEASVAAAVSRTPALAAKLDSYRAMRESALRPLDADAAAYVAGKTRVMSASKAEQYAGCPYSFFCKYGLSLRPEAKAELDPRNVGTFVHYVLERTVRAIADGGAGADVDAYAKRVADEYVENCLGGKENLPASFLRSITTTTALIVELIGCIRDELAESGYTPTDFELPIGEGGVDSWVIDANGAAIGFEGKIDRVDICEHGGRKYLRVIDYKTNKEKKEVSLRSVYNGVDMQMFVYLISLWLNGAARYGEGVAPAGVYYFPANRVRVDASDGKIAEKLADARTMSGMALEKSPIDERLPEKKRPVRYSFEQLALLKNHIEKLTRRMREQLAAGNIPKYPLKKGKSEKLPCEYCDYISVCGVDKDKVEPRAFDAIKDEKVFERLREEEADV